MEGETPAVSDGHVDDPGLAHLADIEVSTDDGPGSQVAADNTPRSEAKAEEGEPEKPSVSDKPAWVSWTQEGGMRIKPGKGYTIDEDGSVVIDPEVAQRIANKRVGRTREEERTAAQRKIAEAEARFQAEKADYERRLAEAAKPATPTAKPWAAKGAPEPSFDDFESVADFTKAMLEWDRAQSAPEAKVEPKPEPTEKPEATPDQEVMKRAVGMVYDVGREKFDDFDAVAGPIQITEALLHETFQSELAPDLLYYYGQHPEELDALLDLEGRALSRAVVKIEQHLLSKDTAAPDADSGNTFQQSPGDEPSKPAPVIKPVKPGASPRRDLSALAQEEDAGPYFDQLRAQGI